MYEVEVKVPADLAAARSRLDDPETFESAVEPRAAVVQVDTYYDAPHRSFPETDEALRIRRESSPGEADATARVTYKGPLIDDESKTREEVETAVRDGEKLDTVLTNLGFDPAATVRKERERFVVESEAGRYTITLDTVDDVGEYVEVETETDDEDDLDAAREGAYDVLERLGLDPAEQIRTSYLELLLAGDADESPE